jgi:hypothetical protein
MNEDDLTKAGKKEKKSTKTAEKQPESAASKEIKATEKKEKKTLVKAQSEPKVKKIKTPAIVPVIETEAPEQKAEKIGAGVINEETVEAEAPVKVKTESAKADLVVEDSVVKVVPRSKKTSAKSTAVDTETAQPAAKVRKTKAKKAEAKAPAEDSAIETEFLPRAAKIQTQENFDLSESAAETAELSPVFKALAEPKLPVLKEENRAFLQMQSPTRIFFYWSLKQDSFNTLRRALGTRADDYFLAIRLVNLNTNRDETHRVENKGSWWFNNVEADSRYRAEVGFSAPGRPFIRIVFSNTLETPRLKPSENTAFQPYFAVTADQFAEVLDLAGFSEDAFEVYLAGDEPRFADEATEKAFVQLTGKAQIDFSGISLNELRYVLFALASGVSLYALRGEVGPDLFDFLAALVDENPEALTEEKVILALEEFFGVSPIEEEIEEEFGSPTVFGASLINFPNQRRKRKSGYNPGRLKEGKLAPVSSFSLK